MKFFSFFYRNLRHLTHAVIILFYCYKEIRLNKIQNKFSKRNIDIFIWREDLAEEKNIPPAYIFKDKNLKKLFTNFFH